MFEEQRRGAPGHHRPLGGMPASLEVSWLITQTLHLSENRYVELPESGLAAMILSLFTELQRHMEYEGV